MANDNLRSRLFTRRTVMLGAGKFTLLAALVGRLYYLQIIKSDEYKTMSDSNRIKLTLIPPLRGSILDRNGVLLAINQTHYRVLIDSEDPDDMSDTLNKLMSLLTIDPEKKQLLYKKVMQTRSINAVMIYDNLSWDDVSRIEVNLPDLPGITIDKGQVRYYPYGPLTSHIIGYVGSLTEDEVEDNPLLNHPDFKIGKNGLEKEMEDELRGQAGIQRTEVNAQGLAVRELSREESKPGNDVRLTIDIKLQDLVTSKLNIKGASAVILDVHNGDVMAMASTPAFDPNEFTDGVSTKYWNELINNPARPMTNKAISSQYPPGSTFKTMVALASLKEGIDPNTTVFCPGYFTLGNRKFHCWKPGGHGTLTMRQGLMHSCNVYFYTMAKRIGIDKYADMARHFGLGEVTGIGLPNEVAGNVPSKSWKWLKHHQLWQTGDTLNNGIGQGDMLATPLQLAVQAARIATGKAVVPNLVVDTSKDATPPVFNDLEIPPKHLQVVHDGMNAVMNIPGGTAYGSRIPFPEFAMAGKTGTSQVISKKYPGQDNSKGGSWEDKNHGLFIGFAPVDNPRYACAVVVEHGGSGAGAAAPVAKEIMLAVQKMNLASAAPAPGVIAPVTPLAPEKEDEPGEDVDE